MIRWLALVILTVLSVDASAQFGTPRDLAFWGKSRDVFPPGMAWRWLASTITNSPFTNWTDVIQGYNFTINDSDAAFKPSWTAPDSVSFDGVSNFLSSTNPILPMTSNAVLCVFQNQDLNTIQQNVFGQSWAAGGTIIIGIGDTTNYLFEVNAGHSAVGPLTTNLFDFLTTRLAADGKYYAFTNGVATQWAAQNFAWNDNSVQPIWVGGQGSGASWRGVLKELIIWTNVTGWTAGNVRAVHKYVVSTYGVTP